SSSLRSAAKRLWRFPTSLHQLFSIGLLQGADLRAILRGLEHGDGGKVGSREIVHEISAIWRKAYVVIGVFRREQRKTLATKADHIEVRLVGIFVFLPAVCQKIDAARLLIHLDNLPYRPRRSEEHTSELQSLAYLV